MRIGYASTSQTQYYDRSPVSKGKSFSSTGIPPHGLTSRWTYTVPSNTRAFVQSASAMNRRASVAGPVGFTLSNITFTPIFDSVVNNILLLVFNGNVVDGGNEQSLSNVGLCVAGDIVTGQTQDTSTGGTVAYNLACTLVEFNAAA